jgi:hypothetical protein
MSLLRLPQQRLQFPICLAVGEIGKQDRPEHQLKRQFNCS